MISEENTSKWCGIPLGCYDNEGNYTTTVVSANMYASEDGPPTVYVWVTQNTVGRQTRIALMPQQISPLVENLQAALKVVESWTLHGQIKELEARLDLLKQQLKEKEV